MSIATADTSTAATTTAQAGGAATGDQKAAAATSEANKSAAGTTIATATETKTEAKVETKTETKAADKAAEVKYDLKLPDGSKLAADHAAKIEAFAKEHKLPPDVAQKLLERDHVALQSQIEMLGAKSKEWAAAVESDKDLGGANFNRTKEDARRAITTFDKSGELARELDATGYGNHPAFVRFAAAIGRAMAEDTIHTGEQSTGARPLEDKLYTTMSAK